VRGTPRGRVEKGFTVTIVVGAESRPAHPLLDDHRSELACVPYMDRCASQGCWPESEGGLASPDLAPLRDDDASGTPRACDATAGLE
jgi:hypothetical protein